jgi:hypothetical protein
MDNLEVIVGSTIAKEAVDLIMAVTAAYEAAKNPDLKEIHVFSSDADSLGMAVTMAAMFPNIRFFVYAQSNRPVAKRTIRNLPENVSRLVIKG